MKQMTLKKYEGTIKRKDLKHETKKSVYDFPQFETIRSFGDNIYAGKINTDEAEMDQSNLLENIVEFNDKSRPKTKDGKSKKRDTYKSVNTFFQLNQHKVENSKY